MGHRPHIVLIGQTTPALAGLGSFLIGLGHEVHAVPNLVQAEPLFERHPIACVVLHVGAFQETGLDDVRRVRDAHEVAIAVLIARSDLVERIAALESGADDVVSGPVSPHEVAARIGGILGRRGVLRSDVLRLERSTVDLAASRLVRLGQQPERLGPGEVSLIRALIRHPRRVLTRDDLMEIAPAESRDANDRSIDTRVARLRRKLDTDAIVTVRGHGYMFVPPFETTA